MGNGLFVIISRVPERITTFTSNLREFTSDFLFYSEVETFLSRPNCVGLSLIIIDHVDKDRDVILQTKALRQKDIFDKATILVIASDDDDKSGICAMEAGAQDYLLFTKVNSELATRVRMHLSIRADKQILHTSAEKFGAIYPLEDRIIIRNALWHMENNLSLIKRVHDLSFYVGKVEKDINRAFRTHFGESTFEYLRAFRINRAKELLLKTRFPITQIAVDVGYSSAANFSTAFKSVVGMSPRDYRRKILLTQ